jgi:hypothetical protein
LHRELEKQVGRFGFERDVAYVVHYQDRIAAQFRQLRREPALAVGVLEPVDPVCGRSEQHPVPGLRRTYSQPDSQVGLPCPRGPEQDHVLALRDERQRAKVGDQVPVQGGQMLKGEFIQ